MKKITLYSVVLIVTAFLCASCNCTKNMAKKVEGVSAGCNPEILQLVGNSVPAEVTINFPAKFIKPNAVIKITPTLVSKTSEVKSTPFYVQGEKVLDNYTVIPYKEGGILTKSIVLPYEEAANISTLELLIEAECKNDIFTPIASIAIAQGISTLGQLDEGVVNYMQYMPDNYRKVKNYTSTADIHYLVNSSKVRSAQLTTEQIDELESFIKENLENEKATLSAIQVNGYASPEGPVKFNDELSQARSKSGEAALKEKMGKDIDVQYDPKAYGEDWEGFKKLVQESNIQDKDLILNVLSMYSSSVKRDEEIRNMSSVFSVLQEEILPELRRTQFVANTAIEGPSDSELLALALKGDKSLDADDMLYAATLTSDLKDKIKIYQAATKFNDARVYNNLGVAQALSGSVKAAENSLKKAAEIQSSPIIVNNLAFVALAQDNIAQAKQYLSSIGTNASKEAQGLISMAEGNFASAANNLTGYYKAVAQTCNNNLSAAKASLANDNSAKAEYLKGVIAAKEGNDSSALSYLKSAIEKDPSLKSVAQNDINYSSLFGTSEFMAL